jgi:hypothetical protein
MAWPFFKTAAIDHPATGQGRLDPDSDLPRIAPA